MPAMTPEARIAAMESIAAHVEDYRAAYDERQRTVNEQRRKEFEAVMLAISIGPPEPLPPELDQRRWQDPGLYELRLRCFRELRRRKAQAL